MKLSAALLGGEEKITLKHTVTQSGQEATLEPAAREFSANGGTETVGVKISSAAVWQAESLDNWIQVTSGSEGNGNGTVRYTVTPNNSVYPRLGSLRIAGKTHKVEQAGRPAFIDSSHASYGPDGGSMAVNVTTEASASWVARPEADWVLVASGSRGSGRGAVMYVVAPFASPSGSRSAVLEIAGQRHVVIQMGYEASIDPDVRNYSGAGGEGLVQVTVPRDAIWKIISQSKWITVIGENSRNSSDQVTYIVAANDGTQTRTGTIIIAGETHTIEQLGRSVKPHIIVHPQGAEVAEVAEVAEGSRVSLSVEASGEDPLRYRWKHNGVFLGPKGDNPELVLGKVQPSRAGTYHVVVSNQYGQAESEGANLVVQEMPRIPSIESQPKGQTAGEGSTVVFRVTASGAEPLKYRWKRDGVFLGAKSPSPELVLKNVKRTQAGVYRVEVSNNLGQVLSESAKLIVTKAAPSTLRFSSVTIDGKGHLTMEVAGPKGSNAVFQYSIDLNEWIDQFALPLPNGTASFKTLNSNSEKLFYRLKLME